MSTCKQIIHPFQYEPGTSQRNRITPALNEDAPKIDGRSLADLLDFFTKLSTHFNYYDKELNIGDWQTFFSKSIPFNLASFSKYNSIAIDKKFDQYSSLFNKRPGKNTLQLVVHFIYHNTIHLINKWHLSVKGSGLPFENILHNLVTDRLREPVANFISMANAAARENCIRSIDFSELTATSIWGMEKSDLIKPDDNVRPRRGRRRRLIGLMQAFTALWPAFTEAIRLLGTAAEDDIENSLFNQKKDVAEQHAPHLALLFAFLKLFQHVQNDMNKFTRSHLDFFYKEVLRIVPKKAESDKAHIVFEIQKQLNSYLAKKGWLVKDAKDKNNQEILFGLDEDIVVNHAQVADVRTLFLNPDVIGENNEKYLVENVYIASNATMADGVAKEFKEGEPTNWSTLGAKVGKFVQVGNTAPDKYPHARIGFVLASPVLLLSGGRRIVSISLLCEPNKDCLSPDAGTTIPIENANHFELLKHFIEKQHVVINKTSIVDAQAKGVSDEVLRRLAGLLPYIETHSCCGEADIVSGNGSLSAILSKKTDTTQLTANQWNAFLTNYTPDVSDDVSENEQIILKKIFKLQNAFTVTFSGKDAWIEPSAVLKMKVRKITGVDALNPTKVYYKIFIKTRLDAEAPPLVSYDKDKLKEDFNTTLPVVKIELNQALQLTLPPEPQQKDCCFSNNPNLKERKVSPYTFLRNLSIIDVLTPVPPDTRVHRTIIHVKVCGLKTFVVQNDENLGDVNAIVFPFGALPKKLSNFYIGSTEVFCKNWIRMVLRFFWKDLPAKLEEYYHGYEDVFKNLEQDHFKNDTFLYSPSLLDNGTWLGGIGNKQLFTSDSERICNLPLTGEQTLYFTSNQFGRIYAPKHINEFFQTPHSNTSRNGFLKLTLTGNYFQHDRYSFVLARQMMALGKFPNEIYIGPVYDGFPGAPPPPPGSIKSLSMEEVFDAINKAYTVTQNLTPRSDDIVGDIRAAFPGATPYAVNIDDPTNNNALGSPPSDAPVPDPLPDDPDAFRLDFALKAMQEQVLKPMNDKIADLKNRLVVIPNPPYTPQIKGIAIDYTAVAKLEDIDLIHLYPFEHTNKAEVIELKPALFPGYCDEGTLFIGFSKLTPGANLSLLFQLAEATANSEACPAEVEWKYLVNNQWAPLRTGFEVLEDATSGLMRSGIVKLAIPGNISNDNTIMPKLLHWIKVSAYKNVEAVCETIGIHTQAVLATFKNSDAHYQLRLESALEAQKLAKLHEANANIKKVNQPYASFGGRVAEAEGMYYNRVSEWLRHKGRAIQKFDYERLVLDAFPEIYKAKCINHEFGLSANKFKYDVNVGAGYVVVAVVPDLNKLVSGHSFEPKAPASLLEDIMTYLKKRTSPFARVKVMNPRYEKIDVCVTVQLQNGRDKIYYKSQLENDLRLFLAPWAVGDLDKLNFGQKINRSDFIRFIENREYVEYITDFKLFFDADCTCDQQLLEEISPLTPRSILVGGVIEVCIPESDCEQWRSARLPCSKRFDVISRECDNNIKPENPIV